MKVIGSPVPGCTNDNSAACRNGRVSPSVGAAIAVHRVADQRVADGGEVDADLVGPAGLQRARQPGQIGGDVVALDQPVLGAGRAAVGDDRHLQRVGRIASDRGVDDAVGGLGVTPHDRVVATTSRVVSELCDQSLAGVLGSGHHQQPRAAGVESVHDARPNLFADCGQLRVPGQQPVDERAIGVAGTRDGPPGPAACRSRSRRRPRARPRTPRRDPGPGAAPPGWCRGRPRPPDRRGDGPCPSGRPHRRRGRRRCSITVAAAERLMSATRATTRSSRWPSSAEGSSSRIM